MFQFFLFSLFFFLRTPCVSAILVFESAQGNKASVTPQAPLKSLADPSLTVKTVSRV
jgi:hypothetical protein